MNHHSTHKISAATLTLVAAIFGCEGGAESMEPPPVPQPLVTCLPGWYLDPATSACDAFCERTTWPECGHGDCAVYRYLGYTEEGTRYSGAYAFSGTTSSFSAVGVPVTATYAIDGDTVMFEPSGATSTIECTAEYIETDGLVRDVRVSAIVAQALSRVVLGGTEWVGVRMEQ